MVLVTYNSGDKFEEHNFFRHIISKRGLLPFGVGMDWPNPKSIPTSKFFRYLDQMLNLVIRIFVDPDF